MKHPITQAIDPRNTLEDYMAEIDADKPRYVARNLVALAALEQPTEATDWLLKAGPVAKQMNRESEND